MNSKNKPSVKESINDPVLLPEVNAQARELSVLLAICSLSVVATALVLIVINFIIASVYHPDLAPLKAEGARLSIFEAYNFRPEPVERLQYQLTMLLLPLLLYGSYQIMNRYRSMLMQKAPVAVGINYTVLASFVVYLLMLLFEDLKETKLHDKINTAYFQELFSGRYLLIALLLYAGVGYVYLLFRQRVLGPLWSRVSGMACLGIVLLVITNIVVYNSFQLADQNLSSCLETNAVLYSMTQVLAGKSLLVDLNAQYGLYAWILRPLFMVTGFSLGKFTHLMALLNGLSYLLIYLGICKVISNKFMGMLVFLSVVFWQYWHSRVGLEEAVNPDYYFQYWPLRLIFPAAVFYLVTEYFYGSAARQRWLLPVLSFVAALGVLWNLDSGLVAYGAVLVCVSVFAIRQESVIGNMVRKAIASIAWPLGALALLLFWFMLSVKLHSGHWPDIGKFTTFQRQFYITGYYMLPMKGLHFWNLVALVYAAGIVYCISNFKNKAAVDVPVIAFLCILGIGLFAYFQGRSYDFTIMIVMYPAIIIAGILCSRLVLPVKGMVVKFHESVLFFFIPFFFIADGAAAMLFFAPEIYSLSMANTTVHDEKARMVLDSKFDFIHKYVHDKDSVIMLARHVDGYYYAAGNYINPVNVPGSSELFLKSDYDTLVNTILQSKYPIIFDPIAAWVDTDQLVNNLSLCTEVVDRLPDSTLLYLKPVPRKKAVFEADRKTMYLDHLGQFRKYAKTLYAIDFPDSFEMEMLVTLDAAHLQKDELVFSNRVRTGPYNGVMVKQFGDTLNRFILAYGDGISWVNAVPFQLNREGVNRLQIGVNHGKIMVFNNGVLCGERPMAKPIANSEAPFIISPNFHGVIWEMKLSTL